MTGTGARAGAGFFWRAGLVAGLQVGQALRCSSYLGLGSAVPAPMVLGTQPPYTMKALTSPKFHLATFNILVPPGIGFLCSLSFLLSLSFSWQHCTTGAIGIHLKSTLFSLPFQFFLFGLENCFHLVLKLQQLYFNMLPIFCDTT